MANVGYRRSFGLLVGTLMTLCISSPSYATTATTTGFASDGGSVFMSFVAYDQAPAFSFEAPLAIHDHRAALSLRHPPKFEAMAIHQRASLAAVRPSAKAGWGSGRLRRLATG